MKTIIAGSREGAIYADLLEAVVLCGWEITEIVSGTAKGVDKLGEGYATKFKIPLAKFPADWRKYGKSAGPIRNAEMAEYAEALIAIWDGESSGTKNMIDTAKKHGLKVYIHLLR